MFKTAVEKAVEEVMEVIEIITRKATLTEIVIADVMSILEGEDNEVE